MPCPCTHVCTRSVADPPEQGKPGVGQPNSQNNPSFSYLSLSHAGTLTTIPGLIESSVKSSIENKY